MRPTRIVPALRPRWAVPRLLLRHNCGRALRATSRGLLVREDVAQLLLDILRAAFNLVRPPSSSWRIATSVFTVPAAWPIEPKQAQPTREPIAPLEISGCLSFECLAGEANETLQKASGVPFHLEQNHKRF